jgi:hypothetical protein
VAYFERYRPSPHVNRRAPPIELIEDEECAEIFGRGVFERRLPTRGGNASPIASPHGTKRGGGNASGASPYASRTSSEAARRKLARADRRDTPSQDEDGDSSTDEDGEGAKRISRRRGSGSPRDRNPNSSSDKRRNEQKRSSLHIHVQSAKNASSSSSSSKHAAENEEDDERRGRGDREKRKDRESSSRIAGMSTNAARRSTRSESIKGGRENSRKGEKEIATWLATIQLPPEYTQFLITVCSPQFKLFFFFFFFFFGANGWSRVGRI